VRSTLDADGRVQIPKHVREEAGLEPGMELDVRYCDGRIELAPAPAPAPAMTYHLERRGHVLVAVPDGETAVLTPELVVDTIDKFREE
jgi:AbrB family looped-hinge helix DNA binding protein